jgi:hypothetical protein
LHLGVGASGASGKLPLTTNDLTFRDRDIATIQGFLGYLNCERDSYVIYLTLGVEEDNPIGSYDVESPVLVLKRRSKKETPIKSIRSPPTKKKGQKGPAQKKIKKEVNNEVSSYN